MHYIKRTLDYLRKNIANRYMPASHVAHVMWIALSLSPLLCALLRGCNSCWGESRSSARRFQTPLWCHRVVGRRVLGEAPNTHTLRSPSRTMWNTCGSECVCRVRTVLLFSSLVSLYYSSRHLQVALFASYSTVQISGKFAYTGVHYVIIPLFIKWDISPFPLLHWVTITLDLSCHGNKLLESRTVDENLT